MKNKIFLLFLLFLCGLYNIFSMSPPKIFYYVVNVSNENILITYRLKDNLKINSYIDDYGIISNIFYNWTGTNIDRIHFHVKENTNLEISTTNTYYNGHLYRKYYKIIERWGSFNDLIVNDQVIQLIKEIRNNESVETIFFKHRDITGKEIFDILFEEFFVTDVSGNIVMRLEDIIEDYFFNDYVEDFIEEYTNDFYDTFLYRYNENNRDSMSLLYGLYITSEIIEQGRKKYSNLIIK